MASNVEHDPPPTITALELPHGPPTTSEMSRSSFITISPAETRAQVLFPNEKETYRRTVMSADDTSAPIPSSSQPVATTLPLVEEAESATHEPPPVYSAN